MENTSATGGFLKVSPGLSNEVIHDILHDLVCGLTGLTPQMVRPRFQAKAPSQPSISENWCAFDVLDDDAPNSELAQEETLDGEIQVRLLTHTTAAVLFTFYGPNAKDMAAQLRAGLQLAQNRAYLRNYNMAFLNAGPIRTLGEPVKGIWVKRADLQIHFTCGPITKTKGPSTPPEVAALPESEGLVAIKTILEVPTCIGHCYQEKELP